MMNLDHPIFGSSAVGTVGDIFQTEKRDFLFHGYVSQGISFHINHIIIGVIMTCFEIVARATNS